MPVDTRKRNERQYKWQVDNADRINVLLPKGSKEEIKAAADAAGISASEFIRQAVREKIDSLQSNQE